jgi:hypothetical protein
MPEIRPFLVTTAISSPILVNAHIKAVDPRLFGPVATLLSQMERDPGEYIVDPWVIETRDVGGDRSRPAGRGGCICTVRQDAASARRCATRREVNWSAVWPANVDAGRRLMCARVERARAVDAGVTISTCR